jgi:hypothetical protein
MWSSAEGAAVRASGYGYGPVAIGRAQRATEDVYAVYEKELAEWIRMDGLVRKALRRT